MERVDLEKDIRRRRVKLRYLRWTCKAAFLILFTLPVAYVSSGRECSVPYAPVNSVFIKNSQPLLFLPLAQSPCSVWLTGWCNVGFGEWLACPLGGLQSLVTLKVEWRLVIPTIIAVLLVIFVTFLLGNIFCGWICPIGTIIDSFDKGVELFLPKLEAERAKRANAEAQNAYKNNSSLLHKVCPIRLLTDRNVNATAASGALALAVVSSAALRFNVFCTICPIGISTRGLFHLKATRYLTGIINNIIIELFFIPVVAVVLSVRERRYWCKKLCPVGALLNLVGLVNPFIKPKIREDRCVMKSCPQTCEDYKLDYCAICRLEDARKCEKVCPVGVKIVDGIGLNKCTKC
ncbi:MAG: 4Fe-4S binding protein, partial [Candidatus Bathyarchaeota archaeon]|nr:4Fe-4S binding protein [Candidatus Bathyarchaeota archaeon]MDW8023552.1 4Fe-4S binding protein [Nitrososphaerota archaeon]